MLSLEFRLVNQYICLLFIRVLSIIDLVFCFHVSCVSKWSPRYLTCLVCVMCVPFNWIFHGFCFRSVNVIWLHLLGFAFVCFSYSHFSIFVICSCSNVATVSGLVCLTSTTTSSANVSILLLVCWPCIVCIILVLRLFLAVPLPWFFNLRICVLYFYYKGSVA